MASIPVPAFEPAPELPARLRAESPRARNSSACHGLPCLLVGIACGCGGPAAAPPPPPVSLVTVPLSAAAPERAGSQRFTCARPAESERTRIAFQVTSTLRDGASAPVETRAIYSVLASRHGAGIDEAEVELESLLTTRTDSAQSAWSIMLDRGWIALRTPFRLSYDGGAWCFESECEGERSQVAASLGDTIELLELPELDAELDGLPEAEVRELTLPPRIAKRLSLGGNSPVPSSVIARRRGSGFPASFGIEIVEEPVMPGDEGGRVSAALSLLASCKLESMQIELSPARAASSEEATSVTHRFTWRFDPSL